VYPHPAQQFFKKGRKYPIKKSRQSNSSGRTPAYQAHNLEFKTQWWCLMPDVTNFSRMMKNETWQYKRCNL
jgi:hypothetical protein